MHTHHTPAAAGRCKLGAMISMQPDGAPCPVPEQATPGLVALPGTGRLVWWTGRVAIGLRYQRAGEGTSTSSTSAWLQNVLLS